MLILSLRSTDCRIKRGLIKRVVVYKLDRISRSILDFATMMETFQAYNVEFVSSTEKFARICKTRFDFQC